ncbi:MAG: phosphoribosylaminoimidazolesuccinocarboxamide synthase [Verrucomicrobia bacterium]|nr:phosphoribosylaminoimidazolesuccinocarboxamide synthase [Verrucomicrobiota bacterium]MCH8528964.1 phosphoribosylaminoimidazolesuccinocarboxamide synthase [Kiritimatiellia bacterium]
MQNALLETACPDLTLLARGKVRDIYEVDDEHLLFVATDRISAFDVIMTNGIPGKGALLTKISLFWFQWLGDRIPHHLVTADLAEMPAKVRQYADQLSGRSMLVKRLRILPVEAIVRGYLAGSGWASYQKNGTVCDIPLPEGLRQCDELPKPIYTPSTKAELGAHDMNISPERAREILGPEAADAVERISLQLYGAARAYAAGRGILLADTKFEFGVDEQGRVTLADEILTPDSSRFWPLDAYQPGRDQPSFDKQFVRNYLESIQFDKQTPVTLPEEVIDATRQRYQEAMTRLTGTV